jgi:hypothetical protein
MGKKIILTIAALTLFTLSSNAQKVNGIDLKDIDADYIEISEIPRMSKNTLVAIDYGQKSSLWNFKEQVLRDDEGRELELNTMVEALNMLSKYGYELVSVYTTQSQNGGIQLRHYVLKKQKATK